VVVVSLLVPFALKSAAGADTVSDKRAQASRLAAQLSALAERSSSLAEAFDQARLHVNDVNTKLAAAKAQLAATTGQLSDAQKRVKDMAVLSYMQGGAASQLSILIPSSVSEIGLRNAYVSSVTGNTNDAVDSLHATKTELSRLQNQLAAAQTAANNAVAQVQADQRSVAASDARTAAAYAQAQAQLGQAVLDQARHQQAAVIQARITATPPSRGIGIQINPFSQPPPPPGVGAGEAIAWAKAEIGKPYEYGGGGPDNFDCSGLTAWAWGHAGTPLPHSSESQYYDTTHVTVAELQPGDLVFFGMPPHHVGLYVGGGQMINALHSGTNVEYDSIYMEGDLIGGGRVN
jgi:cell wall-associated NlpC family hydrolase